MSLCTSCPLSSSRQVAGRGPSNAKVIIVGEYPDKSAETFGMAFHSGKVDKESPSMAFRRALTGLGLNPDRDVYWLYALRCNPYKKAKSVKASDVKACNHNLNHELISVTTPLVIAAGPVAVQSIIAQKGGVTGNRLGWHDVTLGNRPRKVMVTLSPNQLDRNTIYSILETEEGITRDKRLFLPGSASYFFREDMYKLRDKMVELNLL